MVRLADIRTTPPLVLKRNIHHYRLLCQLLLAIKQLLLVVFGLGRIPFSVAAEDSPFGKSTGTGD
jgi:hypothetical protein